jgi:hypothetical protein
VLLAELLDYVATACAQDPADPASVDAVRRRLTVEHPLQAFSPDYFLDGGDPRRRSFNAEYCQALRHGLTGAAARLSAALADDPDLSRRRKLPRSQPVFFTRALVPPAARNGVRSASISCCSFSVNPCRTLLVSG